MCKSGVGRSGLAAVRTYCQGPAPRGIARWRLFSPPSHVGRLSVGSTCEGPESAECYRLSTGGCCLTTMPLVVRLVAERDAAALVTNASGGAVGYARIGFRRRVRRIRAVARFLRHRDDRDGCLPIDYWLREFVPSRARESFGGVSPGSAIMSSPPKKKKETPRWSSLSQVSRW